MPWQPGLGSDKHRRERRLRVDSEDREVLTQNRAAITRGAGHPRPFFMECLWDIRLGKASQHSPHLAITHVGFPTPGASRPTAAPQPLPRLRSSNSTEPSGLHAPKDSHYPLPTPYIISN